MDKLVTVTCKEDWRAMKLQAESIQRFLAPCEHLIIIEDPEYDEIFWHKHLAKYYKNHKLTIKSYNHINAGPNNGWGRQQVFKLAAALECSDKYMIIDSKDFFIKPTDISHWDDYQASNSLIDVSTSKFPDSKMSRAYAKYFHKKTLKTVFDTITPYVIDLKYINRQLLPQQLWDFANLKIDGRFMSEFLFYNYMAHDLVHNFKEHVFKPQKLWDSNCKVFVDILKTCDVDPNINMLGIHRKALITLTPKEKMAINMWIQSLGLTITL